MSRLSEAWNLLMGRKANPMRIGSSIQFVNGQWIGIDDNRTSYITNGYEANDIFYSIINLITDKVRLPDWGVYKIKDEKAFKQYRAITNKKNFSIADYKTSLDLKTKALELVEVAGLSDLMKYPNSTQTMQDLSAYSAGYKLITGGRCIAATLLGGGANQGKPFELNVLPYDQITIIAKRDEFPITAVGYTIASINKVFTAQEVLHDKYDNYSYDVMGTHLYGMAPVKSAIKRLSRNNNSVKASDTMMQNGGLPYVLFIDDPRVLTAGADVATTTAQVNAIKDKLKRGPDRWGEPAISGYKMGAVNLGLNADELKIIETEKWDLKRFCSVWGAPPPLVGDSETSTYNNLKEAEVALTSRCAMPQLVSLRNSLNRKIQTDWGYKQKDIFIDFDQTCFTEMQEDIGEKSKWVMPLPISQNAKLGLLGLETNKDKIFDEVWITPDMGVPLSEWSAGQDEEENQNTNI